MRWYFLQWFLKGLYLSMLPLAFPEGRETPRRLPLNRRFSTVWNITAPITRTHGTFDGNSDCWRPSKKKKESQLLPHNGEKLINSGGVLGRETKTVMALICNHIPLPGSLKGLCGFAKMAHPRKVSTRMKNGRNPSRGCASTYCWLVSLKKIKRCVLLLTEALLSKMKLVSAAPVILQRDSREWNNITLLLFTQTLILSTWILRKNNSDYQ